MAHARASSTDEVVAAAARVFLDKGFQTSTIDDIAAAAGISKPTVYRYAPGKQWLLDEIVRLICGTMGDAQLVVITNPAPPGVRLQWLLRVNVEYAVLFRNSFKVTLGGHHGDLSPEALKTFRKWAHETTDQLASLLAECRHHGAFRWPGDIDHAANLILTMLSATHRWFYPSAPSETDLLLDEINHLFSGVIHVPNMSDWPMPELPELSRETS